MAASLLVATVGRKVATLFFAKTGVMIGLRNYTPYCSTYKQVQKWFDVFYETQNQFVNKFGGSFPFMSAT